MVTFEQLDKRAQLALSIMAAELTYATNRIVAKSFDFRVYNADKFRLYYYIIMTLGLHCFCGESLANMLLVV